jgi:TM2 domain-containing membrane protein YozV
MRESVTGPGSAGNVLAALASLVIPGLGQLAQGRVLSALLQLVFSGILWVISFGWLGWLGHLLAALDAALWRGPRSCSPAKRMLLREQDADRWIS